MNRSSRSFRRIPPIAPDGLQPFPAPADRDLRRRNN
jgi:hypothetical protein